ncbi:uncharacterized protein MONOS_13076 [Monocercomonoides exilis]|uniref:uncharacterized protein n=1 Tax=Monocercomonoides exilis TaxID=2049356 RepID=UPI003559D241|nr:hypothetical protein MONOS_13076 [Monocercomonoides exilis]|eukprot:MONOS_13076.1-p1 / transcript=MONOS_13076.1 / gene=MONOS_13076 / organism=Monocercomonoides_exilis_PA203 / gene_product=unspecified product / transcript_product=unspecified product / location=Mono_scaffold00775:13449-13978(-) / protein_length=131 / sequence_SO=supercontig / SO=protein_coding / is_pseudo=false
MCEQCNKYVKLIEPYELAQLLKSSPKDVVVVDVRDVDYNGYKIPGSRHIPNYEFPSKIDVLIESLKFLDPLPSSIVFHCFASKSRGPKAARSFLEKSSIALPSLDVLVLRGGFHAWEERFCKEQDMMEAII